MAITSSQLTLDGYFNGKEKSKLYRPYFSAIIFNNAKDLLGRVNRLLDDLSYPTPRISSGWRPLPYNKQIGGSRRSWHIVGRAVDLADDGTLDILISLRPELLEKHGLWLEHADYTPGWTHLDTGVRAARPVRIFKP